MSADIWTMIAAVAACVAAVGSIAAAWALYHTRMLDCNFLAEPAFSLSEGYPVMHLQFTRAKPGGPYGRIVGIRVDPSSGVQVAARVPRTAALGALGYGGESWEDPIFSDRADCDVPFTPSSTSLVTAFWVKAEEPIEFRAVLMIEYKRSTVLTKRIEIYPRAITQIASQKAMMAK